MLYRLPASVYATIRHDFNRHALRASLRSRSVLAPVSHQFPSVFASSYAVNGLLPSITQHALAPTRETSEALLARLALFARQPRAFSQILVIVDDLAPGAEALAMACKDAGPTVRALRVRLNGIEAAFDAMLEVGKIVGDEAGARARVVRIRDELFSLGEHVNPFTLGPSVVVIESVHLLRIAGWRMPQLVERAGCTHPANATQMPDNHGAAAGPQQVHRVAGGPIETTIEQLAAVGADRLVLCVPGLSTAEALVHAREHASGLWSLRAVRLGHAAVVDGRGSFYDCGDGTARALAWLIAWTQNVPALFPKELDWRGVQSEGVLA